ncbi:hypothetical protein CRYUN_Cryun32bG0050900 [Craigia yunnanensis]
MTSRKKESEGIALLLSMYSDEDDEEWKTSKKTTTNKTIKVKKKKSNCQKQKTSTENQTTTWKKIREPTTIRRLFLTRPPLLRNNSLSLPFLPRSNISDWFLRIEEVETLVDYGHDEAAMSPEPEEGELGSSDDLMSGLEHQIANGDFQGKTPPEALCNRQI